MDRVKSLTPSAFSWACKHAEDGGTSRGTKDNLSRLFNWTPHAPHKWGCITLRQVMQTHFAQRFATFIESADFPCVGAKSALARSKIEIFEGGVFTRPMSDIPLYQALKGFGHRLEQNPDVLQSFVAGFQGPLDLDEDGFEKALWDRLQCLHNLDTAAGIGWADHVSSDPTSPHFSMSVGGTAYFVVGLHPNASREARRFEQPVLVFNSHDQFEQLRQNGHYMKMRSVIRERDEALQGEINPMLTDHGHASEARQYSGRELPHDWECPMVIRG